MRPGNRQAYNIQGYILTSILDCMYVLEDACFETYAQCFNQSELLPLFGKQLPSSLIKLHRAGVSVPIVFVMPN